MDKQERKQTLQAVEAILDGGAGFIIVFSDEDDQQRQIMFGASNPMTIIGTLEKMKAQVIMQDLAATTERATFEKRGDK